MLLILPLTALPPPALLHLISFGLGLNFRNSEADGSQGNLFMIVAESFFNEILLETAQIIKTVVQMLAVTRKAY